MPRRRLLFPLLAWLLLALPGLLTLAPASWPGVAWARALVAAAPLVDHNARAPAPLPWRWNAWLEGTLQGAARAHFDAHLIGRPLIVRAINQVLYGVFRRSYAVAGGLLIAPGEPVLHGDFYLRSWCQPVVPEKSAWVAGFAARLGEAAALLRARGGGLVLLLAPSKPTIGGDLPVDVCGRDDSQEALRAALLAALAAQDVRVIDGIAAVRRFTAEDPLPAFPRGGIHWSAYNAKRLARRLVEVLSAEGRAALGRLLPGPPDWSAPPTGSDVDYAQLLNLLWPPTDFPAAQAAVTCRPTARGRAQELVVVGTSFTNGLLQPIADCQLFQAIHFLNAYGYAYARYAGPAWYSDPPRPVAVSPALWRELLGPRPLVVLEYHEIAFPQIGSFTEQALDDLLLALRP